MKRRAGIFDPWRQGEPPPLEDSPRKKPAEIQDDSVFYQQHCVQFQGIRAGINVWMDDGGDEDSIKARQVLVDLVHHINARDEVCKILQDWGVYTGTPKLQNVVVLGAGEKKITISALSNDEKLVPRAVDSLALALREVAQQHPDVRDILSARKIRPYTK